MRIILYTGKGGVGKTSVAAAAALRCAELGHRTVVLSTDAAHSLSDSFDVPLGPEPVEIAPNLWGQEVDVYYSIEKYWAILQRYMAAVFSYLNLYGYVTDAIVCNRVMPEEAQGSYFEAWLETQAEYLRMMEEAFAPLPILTVPCFEQEVVGFDMLRRLAGRLFGDEDPSRIFFQGQAHHIEGQNGEYVLAVPLPFVEKQDISLLPKPRESRA